MSKVILDEHAGKVAGLTFDANGTAVSLPLEGELLEAARKLLVAAKAVMPEWQKEKERLAAQLAAEQKAKQEQMALVLELSEIAYGEGTDTILPPLPPVNGATP